MNKNKDFIQLPPLPADMDGDAVSILWEYAKMPDEERKHIREYFDMARQKAGEAEAGEKRYAISLLKRQKDSGKP